MKLYQMSYLPKKISVYIVKIKIYCTEFKKLGTRLLHNSEKKCTIMFLYCTRLLDK